jgi:hypothetical protein
VKKEGFELGDEIARLLKATPSLRRLAERYERCHKDAILFLLRAVQQQGLCGALRFATW